VIAFALPAFFAASCGFCAQPENRDTARCKAERVVTNCGAPEVAKVVIEIAAEVASALASNDYGTLLATLVGTLEHRGITDAWGVITCAINQAQAKAALAQSPDAKSKAAISYAHGQDWKEHHPCKTTGKTPEHAALFRLPRLPSAEARERGSRMPRWARG
jgi:hypothetical protein